MRWSLIVVTAVLACTRSPGKDTSEPDPSAHQRHSAEAAVEIFLVPTEFRGGVVALYQQRVATPVRWAGDTAMYVVPRNGIVRISGVSPTPATFAVVRVAGAAPKNLRAFGSCYDMRREYTSSRNAVAACWLEEMGASGAPPHIAFVVSDWEQIPQTYNDAMALVEVAVFGGKKVPLKWTEPTAARDKLQKQNRSQ